MEQTGDNRALQFLIQKIAIDVQWGNAASVMATIPSSQDWAVCFSAHGMMIDVGFASDDLNAV